MLPPSGHYKDVRNSFWIWSDLTIFFGLKSKANTLRHTVFLIFYYSFIKKLSFDPKQTYSSRQWPKKL